MQSKSSTADLPLRPLLVRCGAFGDMVLVTVLVRDLAARFGGPVDILTSGPWSEPLLHGQPGVGEILTVRSRKTPYWLSTDQQRAVRRLRARGPTPTWFCDGNEAARPLLARAGIPESFIVDIQDHPLLPGEHATQQWRRIARIVPAALEFPRGAGGAHGAWDKRAAQPCMPAPESRLPETGGAHLEVTDAQRRDLQAWLQIRGLSAVPFIAIQMGNKRTMRRGLRRLSSNHKYWPSERWAEVLRHVRRRQPDHAIVLLGTGPEYRMNQELAVAAGIDGLHNLADDLPVPRLIALLARAAALVSVDSGPAHVAAAVDCPQVVLFGRASTSLYRPWGTGSADVRVLTGEAAGEASMLGIGSADVIAAWDTLRLRKFGGA